jgi:hypothetical protein
MAKLGCGKTGPTMKRRLAKARLVKTLDGFWWWVWTRVAACCFCCKDAKSRSKGEDFGFARGSVNKPCPPSGMVFDALYIRAKSLRSRKSHGLDVRA